MGNVIAQIVTVSAFLHACSAQYSPGSADWVPDINVPPLDCVDLGNDTLGLSFNRNLIPQQGDMFQLKYDLPLDGAYDLLDCTENLELRVGDQVQVPDLLTWIRIKIEPSGNGGFKLELYNDTGLESESQQRDTIHFSNDSILCMYLDLYYIDENITLTYTLKFESNTTVQINITVEETGDSTRWNETSLTLGIPDLNLTSRIGLRTQRTRAGDWDRECLERVQLQKMCTGKTFQYVEGEKKQGGDTVWGIGTGVAVLLVVVIAVMCALHRTGRLVKLREWTRGQYRHIRSDNPSVPV